jgi:hypothetical protein
VKVSLQEYCLSYADNSVLKITPFKAQWLLYVPASVTCGPHSAFKYNSVYFCLQMVNARNFGFLVVGGQEAAVLKPRPQ